MSKSDYVEIGSILTTKKGKKYECVAWTSNGGSRCDLSRDCGVVKCSMDERIDKHEVLFVRRRDLESPTKQYDPTKAQEPAVTVQVVSSEWHSRDSCRPDPNDSIEVLLSNNTLENGFAREFSWDRWLDGCQIIAWRRDNSNGTSIWEEAAEPNNTHESSWFPFTDGINVLPTNVPLRVLLRSGLIAYAKSQELQDIKTEIVAYWKL